ncbi:globin-coupled sensor protein [Oricola nitratireducens]|uniref:globin-coupled sensor protein n=1 Tax=Oricola nitratireducens TaxID=2775868 RepID=UPI001867E757|nr:globin-coupled sensor protein [Oricola nitratireducens]
MHQNSDKETCADQDIEGRLAFLGLDETSRAQIRKLKPVIERELPKGLDRFYDTVRKTPETRKFFSSDDHMRAAKGAQIGHWTAITTGNFDDAYVDRVCTIGSTHARIGLEPRWYIGGYGLIIEQFLHGVLEAMWPAGGMFSQKKTSPDETAAMLSSLIKAIMLDMDLSISAYVEQAEAERKRAEAEAMDVMRVTVAAFTKAITHLAAKDLSYRMEDELPEGYQSLKTDFNDALGMLAGTIENILASAETINSGSDEIRSAAEDLSKRAEQQAAAVEETAAAVEQITAAVKSSAGRAEEAGQIVGRTKTSAEQSGEVVRKAIEAMDRINKSSDDISRIIGVIDEIAFQTNLLALNAGVEAARAGDAGKGFAVVAQEVRELAQRSANAAKEIKQLISASGDEVKTGVSLVGETGKALEGIATGVEDIASNVEAIIESAREQSTGLQEINITISSVDQGTQQNAAMAEQLTASSHSLGSEVVEINAMLREFRTGHQQVRAPKAVSEAAPARPRPSPARNLAHKVNAAFGGNAAPSDDWEEF